MTNIKYIDVARRIKNENDISAPINDITQCISEVENTGVNKKCAEKMVINMFKNKKENKYQDVNRKPNKKEILVYNISDELMDTIKNPE